MGLQFLVLLAACFLVPLATAHDDSATTSVAAPLLSAGVIFALVPALRAILTAYDGWYAPIYTAEESTNASRTLPRAIIGGTLLVVVLYLTINLAFLHVLPPATLAASTLPAADAARLVLPRGSANFITVLSIFAVLSLTNNNLLYGPRILFAVGRDGFLSDWTSIVSKGGTPRTALAVTSVAGLVMILTGTFEQILALYAVLFLIYYVSAFLAVFVLRHTDPSTVRPYKALGYPFSTGIALLGSVSLLIAAVAEDPRSGEIATGCLILCAAAYWSIARRRRIRALAQVA
jgi:APA family basic amino acid/polyamine antiporter